MFNNSPQIQLKGKSSDNISVGRVGLDLEYLNTILFSHTTWFLLLQASTPMFKRYIHQVLLNTKAMANALFKKGYTLVSGAEWVYDVEIVYFALKTNYFIQIKINDKCFCFLFLTMKLDSAFIRAVHFYLSSAWCNCFWITLHLLQPHLHSVFTTLEKFT